MKIILGVLLLLQIAGLVVLFSSPYFYHSNNLACGLFFKKERELWKKFISNANDFHYAYNYGLVFKFSSDKYNAYVWEDGCCSIHKKDSRFCVLSSFDKRMSMKMAELLMDKVI